MGSREDILDAVRRGLADVPATEAATDVPVVRDYRRAHLEGSASSRIATLMKNLSDYRARVHTCTVEELPARISTSIGAHGGGSIAVPSGIAEEWLSRCPDGVAVIVESAQLDATTLDGIDSVLTGATVAIAETGTIVLQHGPTEGARMLSLVPDHHI
ncbi:MAG: LUD domain-containing protein, partial [Sciscionella sp.]